MFFSSFITHTVSKLERKTYRQPGRETGWKTDNQAVRQAGRQTHTLAGRQAGRQTHTLAGRQIKQLIGRQDGSQTDNQAERHRQESKVLERQTDRQVVWKSDRSL